MYKNNVIEIESKKKKHVKWDKLFELMFVPSAVLFILGAISLFAQFKFPHSTNEWLIYVLFYICIEVYFEINLKKWFSDVREALNV